MILDANKYRINVDPIKDMTKDKTPEELIEFISLVALATEVPIIIVACYVGELYGFTQEIKTRIARLCEFYDVKEVLNVKYD